MSRSKASPTLTFITEPPIPAASPRLEHLISKLDLEYDDIAALERQLTEAKARAQDLAENIIPEVMANEGMDTFTVSYQPAVKNAVVIKESYHASITRANKDEAYKWLWASKNDDILKEQIIVSFGLKESKEAAMCRQILSKSFPDQPIEVKQTVPGSTLKAFATRMLESGANWPAELFGAFQKRQVVLPWRKTKLTATDEPENAD